MQQSILRKYRGVFKVKSREKIWQVRKNLSQQSEYYENISSDEEDHEKQKVIADANIKAAGPSEKPSDNGHMVVEFHRKALLWLRGWITMKVDGKVTYEEEMSVNVNMELIVWL